MANLDEDVIELGSSDEETEPAPKKIKSISNAMVQIPSKLSGVTIKPANKPKINPVSIMKANIGKAITVTQVKVSSGNKVSNPFASKNINNGKTIVRKQLIQAHPAIANNPAITIMPALKKVRPLPVAKIPVKIAKGITTAPTLIRPLPSGSLPPGITVKRTSQLQSALKRNMKPNPANIQLKRKVNNAKRTTSETVFVDLDDDDTAASPVGPQWYLRPEEQVKKARKSSDSKPVDSNEKTSETETSSSTLEKETAGAEKSATEEQNNKEPDTPKYIEITIEDSPAKPQPKRTCEVSEMAITIDDSPVKGPSDKPASGSGSDEETIVSNEKHSKKKLEYPRSAEVTNTMEIEIELTPVEDISSQNDDNTDSQDGVIVTEIVEIEESPMKPAECFHASTPKKRLYTKPQLKLNDNKSVNVSKPQSKLNENKTGQLPKPKLKLNQNKTITTPDEFHPIYQSFIDLCFRLESSEDMSKIVEKKIKAYYRQVPKEYTESEFFTDMVSSKINAMKAGPEKMYLYIKDVVDELNLQRKIAKNQPPKVTINEEQEKFLYGEDSEFDFKRQRQIRKLEKTLKKLHRAIQKLEEQEVDFDDEEDSVYLLTESEEDSAKDFEQPFEKSELLKRYKERMIRVHTKLCQLTNTKMPSEPRIQIDARPGQPKGPAKRLEKWINKKVPIGTPLPFPDFHDVLRCVRDGNQEDKLGWNEVDIMEEARDLFTRCGKKLQRRRQENEWRLAASRIQSELDPAEDNDELKKALEDNRRVASKKESEVLNKYADRQNQLNLEAVEIGDKEADESPVETDDEETTEESTSLETKEKRKERLKRLLHNKSKKATEEVQANVETNKSDSNKTHVENAKVTEDKEEKLCVDYGHTETEHREKDPLSNNKNDIEKDALSDRHNDKEKDPLAEKENSDLEKIHSLSDDSNKIDSDIDELHLLQKLHSDVNYSSNPESSDSESPISDALSSGDNRKQASDVISIENSSYSESEKNNEQEYEIVSYSQKKIVTESVDLQMEIECSDAGIQKKINKSNNDEYNETVEDILLASSDDEVNKVTNFIDQATNETYIEQPTDKNTTNNKDTTDASSIESIECITAKNTNLKETNTENAEVTSISSTESGDDDGNTNVVEVINPLETVDDAMTSLVEKNEDVTSAKSEVPVEDTDNKTREIVKDDLKTSLTENAEIADKVNNLKSTEDEITEVPSSKHTKSIEDKSSLDKPDSDTLDVIINSEVISTETEVISTETKEPNHTEDITDVIDKECLEKTSNDLPAAAPMEVDDIDKT